MQSPHVVKISDIYEDSYLIYVVMEYMGGGDLRERLNHGHFFSEQEAARIIREIGYGLLACHEHHIYHLDVKPENIIFESQDKRSEMKLTDFGCSILVDYLNKDTESGSFVGVIISEVVGTAGYIAPEVITVFVRVNHHT